MVPHLCFKSKNRIVSLQFMVLHLCFKSKHRIVSLKPEYTDYIKTPDRKLAIGKKDNAIPNKVIPPGHMTSLCHQV